MYSISAVFFTQIEKQNTFSNPTFGFSMGKQMLPKLLILTGELATLVGAMSV